MFKMTTAGRVPGVFIAAGAIMIASFAVRPVVASPVTINFFDPDGGSTGVEAELWHGNMNTSLVGPDTIDNELPIAGGATTTSALAQDGPDHSLATGSYAIGADAASFSASFDQRLAGGGNQSAFGRVNYDFTVTTDGAQFSFNAFYSGPPANLAQMSEISLFDANSLDPDHPFVFQDFSYPGSLPPLALHSGPLYKDHEYFLVMWAGSAFDSPQTDFSASGFARFDINGGATLPTAVPLPAAAGVGFSMLGGFGGLAALRKRLRVKPRIA
jgi:hypothetical protein